MPDLFNYYHRQPVASSTEHDAHPLLAGRAGGQTLYGGTGESDELRLAGDDAGGHLAIENDGFPALDTTVAWDDLRAPATAINPPGQVSDPTWDNTNGGWLFEAGGTDQLWIIFQMPHTYKEGSSIYPHVHWMPTNTNTGNVLWRIDYKWTNVDATDAGSFTQVDLTDAGDGTALKHQYGAFAAQTGTGKTISSIITVLLQRIGGSDTYNANALLKEFDIHYQIDTIGSRTELAK